MRHRLFNGRYRSPHNGHMQIFKAILQEQKPVLIAIRDFEPGNDNPFQEQK